MDLSHNLEKPEAFLLNNLETASEMMDPNSELQESIYTIQCKIQAVKELVIQMCHEQLTSDSTQKTKFYN